MILHLYYFANGNVAACDEAGEQMPAEQGNVFDRDMRRLHAAGLLDADTLVFLPHEPRVGEGHPGREFIERWKRLALEDDHD